MFYFCPVSYKKMFGLAGVNFVVLHVLFSTMYVQGVVWKEYTGKRLQGNTIGLFLTVSGTTECKSLCLQQVSPKCLSISFKTTTSECAQHFVKQGGSIVLQTRAGFIHYDYEEEMVTSVQASGTTDVIQTSGAAGQFTTTEIQTTDAPNTEITTTGWLTTTQIPGALSDPSGTEHTTTVHITGSSSPSGDITTGTVGLSTSHITDFDHDTTSEESVTGISVLSSNHGSTGKQTVPSTVVMTSEGPVPLTDLTTATITSPKMTAQWNRDAAIYLDFWSLFTRGQVPSRPPLGAPTSRSKRDCAAWCGREETCLAFSYILIDKSCQLYDVIDDLSGSWTAVTDSLYYVRNSKVS